LQDGEIIMDNENTEVNDAVDSDVESQENDFEARARADGWTPKEDYKGNPDRWKTAEEFVEFGENLTPILKKQRDEYKKQVDELSNKFSAQERHVQQLLEYRTRQEEDRWQGEITYLKQQLKDARRAGEDDTVDVIQDKIEELKANKPVLEAPKKQEVDQRPFNDWKEENSAWFEKDDKSTVYALGYAHQLRAAEPSLVGTAFFNKISTAVKKEFPELFSKRGSMVESSSPGGNRPAPKTSYERLPAEAKSSCDDFVHNKLGSKEDYLKLYNGN